MDMGSEPDRLHTLDQDIDRFETEKPEDVVQAIVNRYQTLSRAAQSSDPAGGARWPLWQLLQDMQRQAAVYTNVIEQLKAGEQASQVKTLYEDTLELIPKDTLENPGGHKQIERAFKKVSRYGSALVGYVKNFGQQLLRDELGFAKEHTATIEVEIGLPPSVTLGTEFTKGPPGG